MENFRFQISNSRFQIPSFKFQVSIYDSLKFDYWDLFDFWLLRFVILKSGSYGIIFMAVDLKLTQTFEYFLNLNFSSDSSEITTVKSIPISTITS